MALSCIHSSALARLHFLKHQSECIVVGNVGEIGEVGGVGDVGDVGANGNGVSLSFTHRPPEDPLGQPPPPKSKQQIHYASTFWSESPPPTSSSPDLTWKQGRLGAM